MEILSKENNAQTYWYIERFLLFVSIPVIFYLIPYSIFEGSTTICLFKNVFGVECPGCGTTRAIHQVIHLNFANAFDLNRMIIVVFPLLTYLWIKNTIQYYKEAKGSIGFIQSF